MNRLNVKALAIAVGSAWALCMLFAGWAAIFGWSVKFVEIMGSVYIGYEPTLLGGIIGCLIGLLRWRGGRINNRTYLNATAKQN